MTGAVVAHADPRARPVWHFDALELVVCPLRVITVEARELLRLFAATHTVTATLAGARWVMRHLPAHGGVLDQDARTMAGLRAVADVCNQALLRPAQTARAAREVER